jgi:hypothetical protein
MSNQIQVSSLISETMTEFFLQKNPLYMSTNHDYLKDFEQQSYATGGSINIKIPGAPSVQRGLSVTATNIQDLIVPYSITEQDIYSVTRNLNAYETLFKILGKEGALTADDKKAVVDNYGYPAYQVISAAIEAECATRMLTTAYLTPVDTLQKLTTMNSYNAVSECDELCNELKISTERFFMMNNRDARLVADSLQNYFAQSYALPVLKTGYISSGDKGGLAGFDVYRSTELKTHTAGSLGVNGTVLTVTSVSADGSTINFSGAASNTSIQIKAGDLISIPTVQLVDNISHRDIRFKLVVKASEDAAGDGAGNISVSISYPLMASGEHQNVDSLPGVGASAYPYPSRYLNFGYTRAGVSTVPLMLPDVYGAVNNKVKSQKFPVHVYLQGAALDLQNNFRISSMVGIQSFAPYIFERPTPINV